MKNIWWFCLLFLFSSCMPRANESDWDGNYIGYYHQNRQDTTLVKMVFAGKYFAASPHLFSDSTAAEGVFQQQASTLVFHNVVSEDGAILQGAYQFQFSPDGSLRLWQESDADFRELILRQQ